MADRDSSPTGRVYCYVANEAHWRVPIDYRAGQCPNCPTWLAFTGRGRWKRALELERQWCTPEGVIVAPLHRCAHGGRRGRRG